MIRRASILCALALLLPHAPAAEPIWDDAIEVARGEAHRGPWRMNESDFRFVDDPTVALAADGAVVVAWADQAAQDVYLQVYDPDGRERHESPVNVSQSPGIFSWLPRVAVDGDVVHVLFQDIVFSGGSHGGEIFYARSTDGGAGFEPPINLSDTIAGAGKGRLDRRYWHNGSLDLALGPDGAVHAAWTEYEGPLWHARSLDGGASFEAPVHVAGDEVTPARAPSLAIDGDVVHLAWTVGEDPAADIHLATSTDGGATFGSAITPAPSGAHADSPRLALRDGTLHLVWAESPTGPLRAYHLRHTYSEGDGFAPAREIPGPDDVTLAFPALVVDGSDLWVLAEVFPGPRGLALARSTDGLAFEPAALVPGTRDSGRNGSQQGLLMQKLAARDGELAVVNSVFREGEASFVRLWRGRVGESR